MKKQDSLQGVLYSNLVNNKKEWTMVTDKNFEKALMDSNNQRIMNKVSGKYINSIDYDELESEKLIVLWECLKT